MSKLVIIDGPQKGQQFNLPMSVIIGRGYKKGISLLDKRVSFKHAMIVHHADHYVLFDLESTNKTYVNQLPIDSHTLRHSDKILLGDTVLVFIDEKILAQNSLNLARNCPAKAVSIVEQSEDQSKIVERCTNNPETIFAQTSEVDSLSIHKIRQRFRFMCHISEIVGIGLSLDKILKETMQCLGKFFPQVERGVIFLTDTDSKKLMSAISVNFTTQENQAINVSSTILSEALNQRLSIMSSNAMQDERFDGGNSIITQSIKFAMCSPLLVKDELLGAIYLDSTVRAGEFTKDDLALLAGVGSQIAISIKNAQLHQSLLHTEKLKQELAIAHEIQQSFLPSCFPKASGVHFAARTEPARHVGGDLYDILQLPDGRIGLIIGDVAGKGVGAALYMASLISEFRFLANSGLSAQEVFSSLNKELVARGTRGMFVTLLYLIIDPNSEEIICINGGHHSPLIFAQGHCHAPFPRADAPPLGILADIAYKPRVVKFKKGENIILYTDGILEAKNYNKDEYGKQRLEQALESLFANTTLIVDKDLIAIGEEAPNDKTAPLLPPAPEAGVILPEQIIDHIFHQVKNFCGATSHHDDLTMVVAKLE